MLGEELISALFLFTSGEEKFLKGEEMVVVVEMEEMVRRLSSGEEVGDQLLLLDSTSMLRRLAKGEPGRNKKRIRNWWGVGHVGNCSLYSNTKLKLKRWYLAASPALGSVGRSAGVDADDDAGGCSSSTTHFSSLAPAVSIGTLLFMIRINMVIAIALLIAHLDDLCIYRWLLKLIILKRERRVQQCTASTLHNGPAVN